MSDSVIILTNIGRSTAFVGRSRLKRSTLGYLLFGFNPGRIIYSFIHHFREQARAAVDGLSSGPQDCLSAR